MNGETGKTEATRELEQAIARGVPEAELCLRYRKTRRELRKFIDDMQGHADHQVPSRQIGRRTA